MDRMAATWNHWERPENHLISDAVKLLMIFPLSSIRLLFSKPNLKGLARPQLLQPVGKREGFIHLVVLEDVQPPIQQYLPAVVCNDMTGVNGPAFVKFPGEVDPHGASGFLDLFKTFVLQVTLELVPDCDEVNRHFIFFRFVLHDGFEKLHEIADLVEKPNVGVCDGDLAGALQVCAKQAVE